MFTIFPQIQAIVKEDDVEKLALVVRQYYLGPKARIPSLKLDLLLQNCGVLCHSLELGYKAALVIEDRNGQIRPRIVVNHIVKDHERRFLLAHILGHLFIDIQEDLIAGKSTRLGLYEDDSPIKRYLGEQTESIQAHERKADLFAAAILAPKALVKAALAKGYKPQDLVSVFNMPLSFILRRIEELSDQPRPSPVLSNSLPAENRLQKVDSTKPQRGFSKLRRIAKKIDDSVDI